MNIYCIKIGRDYSAIERNPSWTGKYVGNRLASNGGCLYIYGVSIIYAKLFETLVDARDFIKGRCKSRYPKIEFTIECFKLDINFNKPKQESRPGIEDRLIEPEL